MHIAFNASLGLQFQHHLGIDGAFDSAVDDDVIGVHLTCHRSLLRDHEQAALVFRRPNIADDRAIDTQTFRKLEISSDLAAMCNEAFDRGRFFLQEHDVVSNARL